MCAPIRLGWAVTGFPLDRRPGGVITDADVAAAADRYRAGETLNDIAATFGVDKETVRRPLLSQSVRMRDTKCSRHRLLRRDDLRPAEAPLSQAIRDGTKASLAGSPTGLDT